VCHGLLLGFSLSLRQLRGARNATKPVGGELRIADTAIRVDAMSVLPLPDLFEGR